jgi:cyclopropane fatty-acyl-phospholipid synthase-like methyltransferase
MLVRAREQFPQERFPRLHYFRLGLQEIDFHAQFDGAICIDAMEHVFPEDWPDILARFHKALKPGGVLYITVEQADSDEVRQVCDRAKALGLPVVFGELADKIDAAHAQVIALDWHEISGELAGPAAYHYYPSPEQVRTWLDQLGFAIEEEGAADEYLHILARKKV